MNELGIEALDYAKRGEFELAGEQYTRAAYESLAAGFIAEDALDYMLRAALNYRLAGSMTRAENRCRQGILIGQDLQARDNYGSSEETLIQEFIADFHAVGRLEGATVAYETAIQMYEENGIENDPGLTHNGICDRAMGFFKYLTADLDDFAPEEYEETGGFHTSRVAYKMEHMDSLIESFET